MKTLAEQMREAIDDFSDDDGSKQIYVQGFGTWDAASLRTKITRDIQELSERATRGDFHGIHSSLQTGVLVSIVAALAEATAEDGE